MLVFGCIGVQDIFRDIPNVSYPPALKIKMSPENGPFQQEKYSCNHHFSGVMLVSGRVYLKTQRTCTIQRGSKFNTTTLSCGIKQPETSCFKNSVFFACRRPSFFSFQRRWNPHVFEVSGEAEGTESKAVGPVVGGTYGEEDVVI